MYTFQYLVTGDEFLEFGLHHNYSIPAHRKRVMMQRYLIPALYMFLAFVLGSSSEYPMIYYITFGIASILWVLFSRKIIISTIRKNMKAMEKSGKPPFGQDSTVIFGEERVTTTTRDSETSATYSGIEKIILGKSALYLYINAASAFIVPHRLFASEEEKEGFLQFIRQKTNAEVIRGRDR